MDLRYDTITFLSDYGLADEFVGVVHSVVRSIAPDAHVIDLTHELPRHDVRAGGLALGRASSHLCPGVVLAVVDPGVGTTRRAVAVEVGDGVSVLVGPDNGLLAPAVAMCGGATRAVELTNTEYHLESEGPTFAGRDIFAPAAANLCLGVELTELGEEIDPVTLLPGLLPVSHVEDGALVCEVLWVDHFGNVQLNISPEEIEGMGDVVQISWLDESCTAQVAPNFEDLKTKGVGLVTDSYGLVSVVIDRKSAAAELGMGPAMEIHLETPSADGRPRVPGVSVEIQPGPPGSES